MCITLPHLIAGPGLWHYIKHVIIILHSHITRGLTDNRLLKLSPDLLTVQHTHEAQRKFNQEDRLYSFMYFYSHVITLSPLNRVAKSLPLTSRVWDLISEKLCIEVNGERKLIFRSSLNCAMNYTYDVCQS